jgi:hypothetical protein
MPGTAELVTWEGLAFLFALFGVVVVQLLTGQINLTGLLMKKEGDRSFSPERVQLLLATLAAASQYLSQVLKDPTQLPQVPNSWLLLYGGSHALYLGRRFYLSQSSKQKDS